MELKTSNGMTLIAAEDLAKIDGIKGKALKVRLSIISYNRSKNENTLNSCCRNCNDLIKLIEEVFNGSF